MVAENPNAGPNVASPQAESRAHISVVLDRTGSMESIRDDTIGGFNSFLAEQQAQPGATTLSLVQFDSQAPFEVLQAFTPVAAVPALTRETYVPRGGTPLFDAIGRGIIDLDARLAAMPEGERPSRIVFAIVTDGQENASREFTGDQVRGMIASHRQAGWQFVFLSADENAIRNGRSVNVGEDFSYSVAKTARGSQDLWRSAGSRTALYCRSAAPDMNLADEKAARLRELEEERRQRGE